MKNKIPFLLSFICCTSFAQNATTCALIIGISDYQDEDIPDLQFAHKE